MASSPSNPRFSGESSTRTRATTALAAHNNLQKGKRVSAEVSKGDLFYEPPSNSDNPPSGLSSVKAKLSGVDWNFNFRKSHTDIEGLHPYPAKFIDEIPRTLLQILPLPQGSVVLDSFCGSGTTLTECQKLGIASVGVDLNPIACLISRVKTQPMAGGFAKTLNAVLQRAINDDSAPIPDIPNLNHWFLRPVQYAVASLIQAIATAEPSHRDILQLALSSIIVRISNQESDTRYASVEKTVSEGDVYKLFARAAQRIAETLQRRDYEITDAKIIEADLLTLDAKEIGLNIGLVITSPPYPNAYEYWLYHKYRMWWLGFDPIFVKEHEIGARAHFFKKNHHTEQNFIGQMDKTFELLRNVTVTGAYACFVIGRSKIHGRIIDNAEIIRETGLTYGFQEKFSTERVLSPHRKSFNLSHANIKTETILVLCKE